MSKVLLVVLTLFVAQIHSLSYDWPANPTHTPILKAHVTALFGPQSYSSVTGPVLIASPSIFCDVPPTGTAVGILLIERGNCTFYQKAQNAMRAGATGVVIANTLAMVGTEQDYPIRMGYPLTESPSAITIPVVSITARDFVLISKVLLASNQTLTITLGQSAGTGGGGDHHNTDPNNGPNPTPGTPGNGPNNGETTHEEPRHDGRGRHRRSVLKNGFMIAAIVLSSCLCGFCCGRRCGSGRSWCRRQQAAAPAHNASAPSVEIAVPVQSTVHGGERYVQVDSAPVAYYGEQEMAPIPSAPVYEAGVAPSSSSMPTSAPSHYA